MLATTPKEMFDICHHLKYATNGGNIRFVIVLLMWYVSFQIKVTGCTTHYVAR